MVLQSLIIELGAASEKPIPTRLNQAIYAQFIEWLSIGNSYLAESVSNSQESSFSLSGLIGYRRKDGTRLGDRFLIRISLLNSNLIQPLLQGIEMYQTPSIYLENFPFIIRGIYTVPNSHNLVNISNYVSLASVANFNSEIVLNFISPTSLQHHRNIQPFPLPDLVFNTLLHRWNYFAPPELHFSSIQWQSVALAFDLKTQFLKINSSIETRREIGCVGWVKYFFPDLQQARIANILAKFALFSGIGRKTTMGMGEVRIIT